MSAFHLRPVQDMSPSPSPTASTTSPVDYKAPSTASTPSNARPRRPLSPSSLRELDLSQAPDMTQRKYPTPPTGHDLMAMFPPAPPDNIPEMRPGPTSGFFQRQERAFFAQAGKEIVRVRVEVDLPHGAEDPPKPRPSSSSRTWMNSPMTSSNAHHSPLQPPVLYPHPPNRPTHGHRSSISATPAPMFSAPLHTPPSTLPNLHPPHPNADMRSSHDGMSVGPPSKPEYSPEEYEDESWRRPMPYAERRRAGKHTRRVIVRS